MRGVEAEDLARGVRTVPKAVPDLALGVLFAAKQDLPVAVVGGHQRDHGLRLGKPGQVVGVAVVAIRIVRIAIAQRLGRRRHEREPAAGLCAHPPQQRAATVAVELVVVVHGRVPGEGSRL